MNLLTSGEAAAVLGCSPNHVLNLVRAGRLRARNIGTDIERPVYRFEQADLDAFQQSILVNDGSGSV